MADGGHVRSRVRVVARRGPDGATRLPVVHAEGLLAARITGPGSVHLVGTGAGPLGGDEVRIELEVEAGAHLAVHQVAATLALPDAAGCPATWSVTAAVGSGAHLDLHPAPLVVCARARLHTLTRIDLALDAGLELTEEVVLGRHGEPGGTWTGRLRVDRAGRPVLRSTQSSAVLTAGPLDPAQPPPRVLLTRLHCPAPRVTDDGPTDPPAGGRSTAPPTGARTAHPVEPGGSTHGGAVACPLPEGALLVTAVGPDSAATARDARACRDRAAPDERPAPDADQPRTLVARG